MADDKHRITLDDIERRMLAQLVEVALPPGATWIGLVQVFDADDVRRLPGALTRLRVKLQERLRPEVTSR